MNKIFETNNMIITDGGIETSLIYHHGASLREFSSFELLKTDEGMKLLQDYFAPYFEIASKLNKPLLLETPTWRSNPAWGKKLGYSHSQLESINRLAVSFLRDLQISEFPGVALIVSGCVGPRGDGYLAEKMTTHDAFDYHTPQVKAFAHAKADLVTGITMTNEEEAAGLALACKEASVPCVISFTVETNGTLPSGSTVEQAIRTVDSETDNSIAYYMINCAHPTHFSQIFESDLVKKRIKGIRANASKCSHEELDNATSLDEGDAVELARDYANLLRHNPNIIIFGGCCGTDHRHIEVIARVCSA